MRENLVVFQLFFNPFIGIKKISGSTYPKLHFSGTRIYHYPPSPFLLLPNLHRIQDVMSLKWQINFYGICTHRFIFHSKYARLFHTFVTIMENNVAVFCMMATIIYRYFFLYFHGKLVSIVFLMRHIFDRIGSSVVL